MNNAIHAARWSLCICLAALVLAGCSSPGPGVIYQAGTTDALLDGNYDGGVSVAEVRSHGDTGLGTFDGLDGEMVVVDGKVYQARTSGQVEVADDKLLSPLAVVTKFDATTTLHTTGATSFNDLKPMLDALRRGHDGRPAAIRIDGKFSAMRIRSVPLQGKPYRSMVEAVKDQVTFDLKDISGTLVGFWFPPSLSHVNVPGYHLHFISDDRKIAGHVMDFTLEHGSAGVEEVATLELTLPTEAPTTRPSDAHDAEMRAVEK